MADNVSGMAPRDTAPEIKDSKWYQPRAAMHAIRALMQDPEDTSQVFRVTRAMGGPSQYKGFRRFSASAVGRRVLARRQDLADVLNDRDMLRGLPDGSLGRAYLEFVERENLSADGLTDASVKGGRIINDPDLALYAARTRDMHDLWHVTTGYGRDGLGELSLLAFTYAQLGNIGIAMIIYFGARGGVRESGDNRIWKAIWEGYRNGRSATWWAEEDWEGLLAAPLEEVRKQLKFAPASTYRQVFQDHLAAAQTAPAV